MFCSDEGACDGLCEFNCRHGILSGITNSKNRCVVFTVVRKRRCLRRLCPTLLETKDVWDFSWIRANNLSAST
jgi:hypothetical protein